MVKKVYDRVLYPLNAEHLGYLEGLTIRNSLEKQDLIHYFGGVPYALPPIGPYRFRRPRPLPGCYRYGTRASPGNFTRSTAVCPQPPSSIEVDEKLCDEDCLQLNIYIPANKTRPPSGWPVFFYIHGGFLQWGTANDTPEAMTGLLSQTAFDAIIVMPAYRLNVFGFLSGRELQAEAEKVGEAAGNMGFWDQRQALKWTAKNIEHFGGDASNITVGGYSAGSHSAFHQLAHELYFEPLEKSFIRRVIMWSNSPGVQPRTPDQHQKQFDELLQALSIPTSGTSTEDRLKALRAIPAKDLIDVQTKLKLTEFRATTDDAFVSKALIANINNGDFARRMKARGIKLMNGECRDEHNAYRQWRTPSQSYEAVLTRLTADYPEAIAQKLMHYHCGDKRTLPAGVKDWQELFGRVYADMQVHSLERGFHRALADGGLTFGRDVFRYRFDWRASCIDMPEEWGVTHATDLAIWLWSSGLSNADKEAIMPFNRVFAAFVKGQTPPGWRSNDVKEMLRLRSDGQTDVWVDDRWEQGLKEWDLVNGDEGRGIVGWIKARLS